MHREDIPCQRMLVLMSACICAANVAGRKLCNESQNVFEVVCTNMHRNNSF
eukprot:jgi/Antlo1/2185/962